MRKPYVGVTGIAKSQEALAVAHAFGRHLPPNASHRGMAGYLYSQRVLLRGYRNEHRVPSLEDLSSLLETTRGSALNAIHYSTSEPQTLAEQIDQLLGPSQIYDLGLCDLLQMNVPWPPLDQVESIKHRYPNLCLVLQLGPSVLNDMLVLDVARRAGEYAGLVSHVLVDSSGGRGVALPTATVRPISEALARSLPGVPVIFAGGFSDENVAARLADIALILGHKGFGVDAQKRLRDRHKGEKGRDVLSLDRTRHYVKQAAACFNGQD